MRNQRVFQSWRGGFTAAVDIGSGNVLVAYSLCNSKDQFARKTGRIKAIGRLRSNPDNGFVVSLGEYSGDNPAEDVFRPVFRALNHLNSEDFANSENRVFLMRSAITGALAREAVTA